MKRIIASLLAGLCLLALVGCSAGSKADSAAPKDYSQIIHDARTDEDNEYDMIFTKGEDGKFTAIDGYSAEYEADQLNDELKDIVFPLLGLEDGSYGSGTRVMPIRATPPPAMSCFMPWLFAPGLSLP